MPMKTMRRQDDGAPDKMSTFQRINTEFGAWKSATVPTPSSSMMSSEEQEDCVNPNAALSLPPPSPGPSQSAAGSTATTRPCKSLIPRAIPRYTQMDMFIEGLDAACEALPTPLVGFSSSSGSASADVPPPPPRATLRKDHSSAQQYRHHYHHYHQPQHSSKTCHEDRPPRIGGIVKEVKFADEVIEFGESPGLSSAKIAASEVRKPPAMVMADIGARVSRAMRFDYKKRRSDYVKAATVVQSTYRGCKVHRGQPVKYLLVISSVKEKLEELRQQFDAWKIAAWFPTDLTERATMTDSVMDLLLQLDSLQGVPVVVREFRKNVARDVIKFQEEVDGFLCRNSKHGVLFDMTRQKANAAQGSSNVKQRKAIRNIVVQENISFENGPDNNPKACRIGHNGSWQEDVKGGGTTSSTDVASECGSDCQRKNTEVPLYSVRPPSRSRKDFVLWTSENAEFERVGEKSREDKQPESVTELKKCVASTDALDIYIPPDRKKNSLGPRYGIVHFGNKGLGKEHLSFTNACPRESLEDASLYNSTSVVIHNIRHASDVSSMDFTPYCQKKEDSRLTVSMSTERSLKTTANGKIHIPEDFRIGKVHENLEEDRKITHQHTLVQPDNYSSRKKWEAEFPADDCKVHASLEVRAYRQPHTQEQDYSSREKCKTKFPADANCGSLVVKGCSGMEDNSAVIFEPPFEKNKDTSLPTEVVTSSDLYDDGYRHAQTKLHASPSQVDYASAKDVREGTIEPLLASDQKDKEINYYPVPTSQLDCASKHTFRYFDEDDYFDSSHAPSEGNRISALQDMPNSLSKEGDTCLVVFTLDEEQLRKFGVPVSEATMAGHSTFPENPENVPLDIPSAFLLDDNIREQFDREPRSDYEPCNFDDLETISSCSNCAACPAESVGEPGDFESGVRERMPHQSYALKGLVRELDDVLSADRSKCEFGYWKDQAWRDESPTKFQPYHNGSGNSLPEFQREVEVQREDNSFKTVRAIEYDELQCFQEIEQSVLAEARLASSHEEDHPDKNKGTCLESEPSKLPCTSQSSVQEGAATGSTTSVPHEGEGNLLLTKLVEDNKRLKELLTEVMKWNTAQASAMITLNERLELVESKK